MTRKYLIITLLLFFSASFNAMALQWHESLVTMLIMAPDVDKSIAVERNPVNNEIIRATYKFNIFTEDKVNTVKANLLSRAKNANKFSYNSKEKDTLLLQVIDLPNTVYSYKLSKVKDSGVWELLITVEEGKGKSEFSKWEKPGKEFLNLHKELAELSTI